MIAKNKAKGWEFWIDRGGTFTDIVAKTPQGKIISYKLLSVNPGQYKDPALAGIKKLLGLNTKNAPIPTEKISGIKMGTTIATNALLERSGSNTVFVTTKGFKDILIIGDQTRSKLFNLNIVKPKPLYKEVVEVNERINAKGEILFPLNEKELIEKLSPFLKKGFNSVAIAFLHSHFYPKHERQAEKIAKWIGFSQVSVSHKCGGLIKFIERSQSAVVDAYLTPVLQLHVKSITGTLKKKKPLFMQSNGGLVCAEKFRGKDSILSGPAGGVVGAVRTAQTTGIKNIISFDMGGTSTDVAHFDGEFERTTNIKIAGIRLQTPTMHIQSIASGGGSICFFDGAKYRVGPESAAANPGPACYRCGGPLCITDCNVILGKIRKKYFPKLFGKKANQSIDTTVVRKKFSTLAKKITYTTGKSMSCEQVAEGFIQIAVANMVNAIKKISLQRGKNLSRYTLCCFGGAGGQHACSIAENLGIQTIFIHPQAGALSAYGMGLAEMRSIQKISVEKPLNSNINIKPLYKKIKEQAKKELFSQGVTKTKTVCRIHLRYQGSNTSIPIPFHPGKKGLTTMVKRFKLKHQQYYGFTQKRPLTIATLEVEVMEKPSPLTKSTNLPSDQLQAALMNPLIKQTGKIKTQKQNPEFKEIADIYFHGKFYPTPVYERKNLQAGHQIIGPAIIVEEISTTVVDPGWSCYIDKNHNLILKLLKDFKKKHFTFNSSSNSHPFKIAANQPKKKLLETPPDPVLLSIFNNLFMSIAEQMGVVLEKTAISVNIKERRDFSCALFDASGALIANAPHIPIHLGSMSESVKNIIQTKGKHNIKDGEVYALNDPYNGGTHLPDITVVTPVFNRQQILFFAASRGHHADIGGITPGSMPSNSIRIEQEGVLLKNITLVKKNRFLEKKILQILNQPPYPARNPKQNIADLKAQISANSKGVQELKKTIKEFGSDLVQTYVQHVQQNAKQAISHTISRLKKGQFIQKMDGGQVIKVKVKPAKNRVIVNFKGTSPQLKSNFNAPSGVCKAAVLYVFRTLVKKPIPMNEGVLAPIELIIPKGSMLAPIYPAPVAGGNVETSQSIVEALYGAFGIVAQSQGTMNNFSWGNKNHQYYETICGGSGAGPGFHGADAVQTHMTNSHLTDPEILEWNFPVLLENFSIRKNSGGCGQYKGGNGVIRRIRFLEPMTASILSERRIHPPLGINGGKPGKPGKNYVKRANGTIEKLPGSTQIKLFRGDVFIIKTPGGGGFGKQKA